MRVYLGVDPGKLGGVVAIRDGRVVAAWRTEELFTAPTGKGTRRDYVPGEMVRAVSTLAGSRPSHLLAVLERQKAMPGQGVASMFSIGFGYGLWVGILAAKKIPTQLVEAPVWTREILRGTPGEGKERAVFAAMRLLPDLNLRPGQLKNPHTGLADAACLALWGARMNGRDAP